MKLSIILVGLLFSVVSLAQSSETITNETIISLSKVGLSSEVLKSKILSSTCNFNLSTDGLIALKKEGIQDEVINAMLTKASSSNSTSNIQGKINDFTDPVNLSIGIYYFDSSSKKFIEMDPSLLGNQRSGSFGSSMIGLVKVKDRGALNGAEASIKFKIEKPKFIFVFDTSGNFKNNSSALNTAQSPNEFVLAKFKVVKKTSREIVLGSANTISSEMGIPDNMKVAFNSLKLKKGVYEVTPSEPLKTGEYCFIFAGAQTYDSQSHKVYDFSIKR